MNADPRVDEGPSDMVMYSLTDRDRALLTAVTATPASA